LKNYALILKIFAFLILLFLAGQAFLFDDFALLQIREIDDLAFQQSTWKLIEAVVSRDLATVFGISDYGYGWVFWCSSALISLPGYIVYKLTEMPVAVIVAPRLASLVALIFTWLLLRRILQSLKLPKIDVELMAIAFLLIPGVAWFSIRYGTVTLIGALIAGAIYYLVAKEPSKRSFLAAGTLVGLALGVKLSALVAIPALALIAVVEGCFRGKKNRKYFLIALPVWLVASHPPLLATLFAPWIFTRWIEIQKSNTLNALADSRTFVEKLVANIVSIYSDLPLVLIFVALALCGFVIFLQRTVGREKIILSTLGLVQVFSLLVLLGLISQPLSVVSYFLPFAFLQMYFWFKPDFLSPAVLRALSTLFVMILVATNLFAWNSVRKGENFSLGAGYYLAKFEKTAAEREIAAKIRAITIEGISPVKSVVFDYTAPTGITSLEFPDMCVQVFFGNLDAQNQCDDDAEFVFLDSRVVSDSRAESQEIRNHLRNRGVFRAKKYQKLQNIQYVEIFRLDPN
jgi:hypothetical protein